MRCRHRIRFACCYADASRKIESKGCKRSAKHGSCSRIPTGLRLLRPRYASHGERSGLRSAPRACSHSRLSGSPSFTSARGRSPGMHRFYASRYRCRIGRLGRDSSRPTDPVWCSGNLADVGIVRAIADWPSGAGRGRAGGQLRQPPPRRSAGHRPRLARPRFGKYQRYPAKRRAAGQWPLAATASRPLAIR